MSANNIISLADAQQLVERIARGYGWISQRARDASDEEALEAIKMLQKSLGIAVTTLAKDLYDSKARFIFELIQNAEDNDYIRATSQGAVPYINFKVSSTKIVIDSNEDGFTPENVTSICKVGDSSKSGGGAQYIGEKGIGFKSVFMVASKVHIQSGPFSFCFEHAQGEPGMGLVTPLWKPVEVILPDPCTRMTLTPLKTLDYSELLSQFDTLPDTFLLFLSKLGTIIIDKVAFAGNSAESTTFSRIVDEPSTKFSFVVDESFRQVTLKKVHLKGLDSPQINLKHYYILRKTLNNLRPDENRDTRTAEVVLAFPFDLTDDEPTPIISSQQIYAYLPVGYFGFHFLIQSDFVTQASRQGVKTAGRNEQILDGIAEAFLEAVLQFCKLPTLQYKWARYLPGKIEFPFWDRLRVKIYELLKGRAILRGLSHGPLRPISQLKRITEDFKDECGNPLVADLEEELYLASEYQEEDIVPLVDLGLEEIKFPDVMARFRFDITQPISISKFKSPITSDYWHTKAATLLLEYFQQKGNALRIDSVQELPCIPLHNGKWTAIAKGAVYFPRAEEILIPTNLNLSIVDEKSTFNKARKKLFIALGVEHALLPHIRKLILRRYENKAKASINFETSFKDLHFLYSAHSGKLDKLRESTALWVFNHRDKQIHDEEDLYFQSNEEYSFHELMGSVLEVAPYNSSEVGSFIHPDYCKRIELPQKQGKSSAGFKTWLQKSIGILSYPRLVDPKDPELLSPVFRYIIEKRPEKLLGTLQTHWNSYADMMSSGLAIKIAEVVVPTTNIGSKSLKDTFVPLETLMARCGEFLDVEKFPFLKLRSGVDLERWKFLGVFHVGIEDNLEFWLQILYYCKLSKCVFRYQLYEVIQQKIWTLGNTKEDVERVRAFIFDKELILAPSCPREPPSWTNSSDCLWDAPDYLTAKRTLLPFLSHLKSPAIAAFFQNTLGIVDVIWKNFLIELKMIKKQDKPDVKIIHDIYVRLQTMSADLNSMELQSFLAYFEKEGLIYDVLSQVWVAPSMCLWSKDAQVPGKSTISGQYENLKDLFVGVLKVKIPDLRLLVEELERIAQSSSSIVDIKSLIWQINTFGPTIKDLSKLRELRIFPVRKVNEVLELRTRLERFSIIDRQPWANALEGEIDFLDFDLKEVRALEPFLTSMELKGYLSENVIEKSSFQGILPEPSTKRTRDFRRRAYALSRCATHFGSPRTKNDSQALYQLLLKTKVYETDGIIGSLEHNSLGEIVTVELNKLKLHIEERLHDLSIYVPKDSKDQEICYLRLLPTKLFNETMMVKVDSNSTLALDSIAVSVITAILASSDEVINLVLEEAGIVPVSYNDDYYVEVQQIPVDALPSPGFNHDYNEESETASVEDSETAPVGSAMQSGMETPEASTSAPQNPSLSIAVASMNRASTRPNLLSQPIQIRTPPRLDPEPVVTEINRSFTPASRQVEFRRLLDDIITAARNKRGRLPSQGAFNLDALLNALPVEIASDTLNNYHLPFGIRNENQLEHDMKIGAAGELYAFEILSRLETPLTGFGHPQWQSKIRKYVKIHENYRDMEVWREKETADIVYQDEEGELTQLLIANGYLNGSIWSSAKPKYFLEVKTTTKECGTRLFLSKNQYNLMRSMKLSDVASAEIYIILRVFNLNNDKIDMQLYVDPAGMEDRNELEFIPDSYTVVPRARGGH